MRRRRALEFTLGPGSARRMFPLPEGVPALFPGVFNRSGRGSPNVATQAVNFKIITDDILTLEMRRAQAARPLPASSQFSATSSYRPGRSRWDS
jgi:hypothetical protein